MERRTLKKGLAVGLALSIGAFVSEYIRGGSEFPVTSMIVMYFACTVAGILGAVLDEKVSKATNSGPNTKSLSWYSTPVLWFGIPMVVLCVYIVVN